jgi:NAD(P)-dependent dehydrogenase (short-subunit alcohol dehydrogenase family)
MTDRKVAVVVGGSRGIGAAVVRLAASRGYCVVFTYASRAADAEALTQAVAQAGGEAHAVQADAASGDDIATAFERAAQLGTIRALVYSAGITGTASPLAEAEPETLQRVIEVNLLGAMLAAREAVRRMSAAHGGPGGAIVFLSSRAAALGSAGEYVWYAASKGGLDSLAIGLAKEVGAQGVRVNCVSPGPVATDMLSAERQELGASRVPMQRVGRPEEIAEAVLFLLSDEASYVTGANLSVSGGA